MTDVTVTAIAVAVVDHDGQFLIGQRSDDRLLPGLWEFPGGKIEADESPAAAAARECEEETGLAIEVGDALAIVEHDYPHGRVRIHFLRATPKDATQRPQPPFHWVDRRDLASYEFPAANRELLKMLNEL